MSLLQRTAKFDLREYLAAVHVGGPLAIPKGLAGSVARLDNAPIRAVNVSIYAQAAAAGSPLRLLGSFDWAAGANVGTRSGPGGLLAPGDALTVQYNGSTRPIVLGLAITLVGVHV